MKKKDFHTLDEQNIWSNLHFKPVVPCEKSRHCVKGKVSKRYSVVIKTFPACMQIKDFSSVI